MSERSVIVHPPTGCAGRQVWVDGRRVGLARSLGELTTLLHRAGWEKLDEVDVAELPLIEWHGGGPEVWTPWTSPWPTSPTAAGAGTE
ncbi:hypothetical protein G3I62_27890 [Streptomyces sp. SID14446]|uniref:hypothetical protein n=1 Tax=unclassified Streptomyces TaxID=2593676 RepID=UPI0013B776BD|nr:hypothetical protein [Streptomyces sp. SID14446]NEB32868.1 hypothetical protein [Streptomyces sp. SID14446]